MPKSVALNIGPIRLSPPIAMGTSTALLLRRLPMTASPGIGCETVLISHSPVDWSLRWQ